LRGSSSQDDGEPSKEACYHDSQTVHLPDIKQGPRSSTSLSATARLRGLSRPRTPEPVEDSPAASSRCRVSSCRCRRGRGGDVHPLGVLGAAGVLCAAIALAGGVTAAVGYALVVVFSADVVGDCLGVLGGVGGLAVAADTAV